jgi:hypothetical protein
MKGQVRSSTSVRLREVRNGSRRMRPPRFLPTGHEQEPMSDPTFTQPDLFSIPAAEQAELAPATRGILSADSYPPADNNPLASLARDAARPPAEVDFMLHHCHRYDLIAVLARRVYLMPIPAESGIGPRGITVSWTTHGLLPYRDWRVTYSHTSQLTNAVSGSGLQTFGYLLHRQCGTGGVCLATGHRRQRTEAGR